MKIYIVGSGKLASAILSGKLSFESGEIIPWRSEYQNTDEMAIVVHAGSGRQLKDCISFCERTKSILIELSTGLETDHLTPGFPLILCPNTSLLSLKTMMMLKSSGQYFEGYKMSITESHQSTKTTEPGTAYNFARSLKFPVEKIVSIRDRETQHAIGIEQEYLSRHAYHKIVIEDGSDQLIIETKVLGHETYVHGVQKIIQAVLRNTWQSRSYTVLQLIDQKML